MVCRIYPVGITRNQHGKNGYDIYHSYNTKSYFLKILQHGYALSFVAAVKKPLFLGLRQTVIATFPYLIQDPVNLFLLRLLT